MGFLHIKRLNRATAGHGHRLGLHRIWPALAAGLTVLALVLLVIGLSTTRHEPKKIIIISKTSDMGIAFWWSLNSGVEAAAKEFGVPCEYRAPAVESEVDLQISLVRQAITERPDAIILAATDYERLAEPAREVVAAGIKLVMMDSTAAGGTGRIGSSFVATDNVAAGLKAGQTMRRLLPKGKRVAIISPLITTNSSKDRDAGARAGLDPAIEVLPTVDSSGSADIAYAKVKILLQDASIGGYVCLNEYSTVGAARAIRETGLAGQVVLVGFDSSQQQIADLESGLLSATVIQRPFNMGYLAVARTIDLLKGRRIDPFYDTGSILITKENMYLEENEKLLFPFQ